MKTTKNILTVATLATALAANLSAEPAKMITDKVLHKITVEKLEVEIRETPRFSVNLSSPAKQTNSKLWLEIEAKLDIQTKSKLDFLPTVEATFYVVTKADKGFVKSERTITFKNVNIEHGEAWVCAYIDPDTLRVITNEKRPKVNDITGIAVTINTANLYKGDGQEFLPYAEEIFDHRIVNKRKDLQNKNTRWWTNLAKSDQKILTLQETPFSAIFSDRYPRVDLELKMEYAKK